MSDSTSFDVRIFTPRWGHEDSYTISVSRDKMTFGSEMKATCKWVENRDPVWTGYDDMTGNPVNQILKNDLVFPSINFVDALESAWIAWRDGDLDNAQLEAEVKALIDWLNICTHAKPDTEFWRKVF
ncbi:hypothetical protein ACFL6E_07735 [Candidatus Neomarinimicrobiota bacterium]